MPLETISKAPLSGQEDDKTRITIALACNADGSRKHKIFFIGNSVKPRCLSNKKKGGTYGYIIHINQPPPASLRSAK